jgi:hypothetical protein
MESGVQLPSEPGEQSKQPASQVPSGIACYLGVGGSWLPKVATCIRKCLLLADKTDEFTPISFAYFNGR